MNPEEKPIAYIGGALNDMACDYIKNMHQMIKWSEKIRLLGYAVFVPGIDFLIGIVHGDWGYKDYFDNSQAFLVASKIMFIAPGWKESKGTAREIITARKYNIPIFYGQEGYDLLKWQYEQENQNEEIK